MRIEVRGKASGRTLWQRLFTAPALIVSASLAALALGLFLVGIIVGAYFVETDNGERIEFLTRSSFAQNVVHDGLSWGKAMADGENVPGNFARGVLAATQAQHLVIDIKHEDYQRLAGKRARALELGVLFADASDYVPARLTCADEAVRVKLRLKGDLPDHYETDKWSLRVRVRGDHTFQGLKRFSIQHPQTRNFLGEWLFMEALRREGLVAPRYDFVDVTINGEHKGIYALEEHFDKRLLEGAERRAGPIVRFYEDLKWVAEVEDYDQEEYGSFSSSPIEGYAAEDTSHGSEYERAASLLEGFRTGVLSTSQVFDTQKLAVFLAMRDLCGAGGAAWQNFRFYYDPVTSKLEPIAFDSEVDIHDPIRKLFSFDGGTMHKASFYEDLVRPDDPVKLFFADLEFFERYVQELAHLSAPEYWGALMADLRPELNEKLALLHRDYPYYRWSEKAFEKNAAFIRSALNPPRALHAYHERTSEEGLVLRLGNIQSLPVEILGVSAPGEDPTPASGEPSVLRSKRRHAPVDYVQTAFRAPAAGNELTVHYRLLGMEEVRTVAVYPWAFTVDRLATGDWIGSSTDLDEIDWIREERESSVLRIAAGTHVLDRTLVIPAGHEVVAGPGVRIDLVAGAKIISRSPLYFAGTAERPIVLESSDATGQGLVVMGVEAVSTLSHVVFDNLDAPGENGWRLAAAVTFYESPVELESVLFRGSRCEDALNVMRTHFTLTGSSFAGNAADAFDGDFVVGTITDCRFAENGNDALDFSGAHVEVSATVIDGVGDKGISAGEHSVIVARDVSIMNAELAVVSKDLSSVSFIDGSIESSRIAFCAFQKKPEFGGGTIAVVRAAISGVEREYLIESDSSVTLDGEEIELHQDDVERLLYGAEYGRASD